MTGAKTPPPVRRGEYVKNIDAYDTDGLTATQTLDSENALNKSNTSVPKSAERRKRGARRRTVRKTPEVLVSLDSKSPSHCEPIFNGVNTMDDFANMLLAKHESVSHKRAKMTK